MYSIPVMHFEKNLLITIVMTILNLFIKLNLLDFIL